MSAVKVRDMRFDLLEDHPCAVVSAALLHVDFCHGSMNGHSEVDILGPLMLGNTEDLHLELLLPGPVTTRVASERSVRCILRTRTLGKVAGGAGPNCRWNRC